MLEINNDILTYEDYFVGDFVLHLLLNGDEEKIPVLKELRIEATSIYEVIDEIYDHKNFKFLPLLGLSITSKIAQLLEGKKVEVNGKWISDKMVEDRVPLFDDVLKDAPMITMKTLSDPVTGLWARVFRSHQYTQRYYGLTPERIEPLRKLSRIHSVLYELLKSPRIDELLTFVSNKET